MATITLTEIAEDAQQVDGRRFVTERHVDSEGAVHRFTYLLERAADAMEIATARRASILSQLAQHEIAANIAKAINGETNFLFRYSTASQNRTALHETFDTATRWERLTLGWVINGLNLSDNQLKTLFKVNDAQLPTVKARLVDMAAKHEDAIASAIKGSN